MVEQAAIMEPPSDKLLEDTFCSFAHGERVSFLLEQGASFSQVPCGLDKLLEDTFRSSGDSGSVDFLLRKTDVETLFKMVEQVRVRQIHTQINASVYEKDGIRWPQVTAGEDPNILTKSIVFLKAKGSGLVEITCEPDPTNITTDHPAVIVSKTILEARSPYFKALFSFNESSQQAIKVQESYHTISFLAYYAETEPEKVDWKRFCPSQAIGVTADNLDILMDIQRVADMFLMIDLSLDVQSYILSSGICFIQPENVLAIKELASQQNAHLLEDYSERFFRLNVSQEA